MPKRNNIFISNSFSGFKTLKVMGLTYSTRYVSLFHLSNHSNGPITKSKGQETRTPLWVYLRLASYWLFDRPLDSVDVMKLNRKSWHFRSTWFPTCPLYDGLQTNISFTSTKFRSKTRKEIKRNVSNHAADIFH